MKDKHFDLFAGNNKKIVIKEGVNKNKSSIFSLDNKKTNEPNFIKKCKNKSIDPIISTNIFTKNSRPKANKHGFFQETKKMLSVAILICTFFVLSSGISNGIQKKNQLNSLGKTALSRGEKGLQLALNGDSENAIKMFNDVEFYLSEIQMNISILLYQTEDLFNYKSDIESLDNVIKFAEEINETAKSLLELSEKVKNIGSELSLETNYIDLVDNMFNELEKANLHLNNSKIYLDKFKDSNLLKKYTNEVNSINDYLSKILNTFERFNKHKEVFKTLLGDKYPHTILFLLQNSHEIRANGGFIGSLLFVTFNDGKISNYQFKDVFDFDSQLPDGVEPPEPLKKLSENWGLRDANYYPNFPDSAKKIRWFLEHEKGDSVDTIIAINEQLIENFLDKTGEMQLFENGEYVNSKNFSLILSFFVEAKIFGENTPKKVVENFMPIFFSKIKSLKINDLAEVVLGFASQNHVLAFSFNKDVQDLFEDLGISGEMNMNENQDFLSVVHTSISANKSDGFIKEKIAHKTYINLKGEVFDKLSISRSHTWGQQEADLFDNLFAKYGQNSLREKEALKFILGSGRNQVWTRVYVPLGSVLTDAKFLNLNDIHTSTEGGFTVFSFYYPSLNAGETKNVEIFYKIKNRLSLKKDYSSYRFCFKKASGISEDIFDKDFELESGLQIIKNNDSFPYEKIQKTDKCFSILLAKGSLVQN